MTIPQNWFTHSEAATYCRISPRTLRRWRTAGRIRAYGGKYFREDLDRAVRNEPVGIPVTVNGQRVASAVVRSDGYTSIRLPGRLLTPLPAHALTDEATEHMVQAARDLAQRTELTPERALNLLTEAARVEGTDPDFFELTRPNTFGAESRINCDDPRNHPFEAGEGSSGMVCTRMVMRDGGGDACGADPATHDLPGSDIDLENQKRIKRDSRTPPLHEPTYETGADHVVRCTTCGYPQPHEDRST